MRRIPVALAAVALLGLAACADDGGDPAASSPTTSRDRSYCTTESAGAARLVAAVGRFGSAYSGQALAAEGDFESASSPLRSSRVTTREDAVAMLREVAARDPALGSLNGVQSASEEPHDVAGHTVVEATAKYGTAGRVHAVVDCDSGLVRRVDWLSFG